MEIKDLTRAEEQIIQVLWALEKAFVKEIIDELALNFPDLKKQLLDETGNIRSFVNIFVDEDDIRNLDKEQTKVSEASKVSLIPAIAGGNSILDFGCEVRSNLH